MSKAWKWVPPEEDPAGETILMGEEGGNYALRLCGPVPESVTGELRVFDAKTGHMVPINREQIETNPILKLIAAAPELLVALTVAVKFLHAVKRKTGLPTDDSFLQNAEGIIAKATG